MFPAADAALDQLQSLSNRVRGRLALFAERVEADLAGLPPLLGPSPAEAPAGGRGSMEARGALNASGAWPSLL